MKYVLFIIILSGLSITGKAQYANGHFLSVSDFSWEDTRHYLPIPNNMTGKWIVSGVAECDFHETGNAIVITLANSISHSPGVQKDEVIGILSFIGGQEYNLAIRIKDYDGTERIEDVQLAYYANKLSDASSTYIIERRLSLAPDIVYTYPDDHKVTYFKSAPAKKKKKKRVFGKILKGAGSLIQGAASVYASTQLGDLSGSVTSLTSSDILSKLVERQSGLNDRNHGHMIKGLSDVLNTNDSVNLENILSSLIDQKQLSENDLSKLLEDIGSSKRKPGDSESYRDSFDSYADSYWSKFEKDYGNLLDKLFKKN